MPTKNNQRKKRILLTATIMIGLLIFVSVVTALLMSSTSRPNKLANADDVRKLHSDITDLKSDLSDEQGAWQDTSSCTIINARKFGDKETYYCSVEYSRDVVVTSQEQINGIIKLQSNIIDRNRYVNEIGEVVFPNYPGSSSDITSDGKVGSYAIIMKPSGQGIRCAANNRIQSGAERTTLRQDVGCNIDTSGTFFDKVNEV